MTCKARAVTAAAGLWTALACVACGEVTFLVDPSSEVKLVPRTAVATPTVGVATEEIVAGSVLTATVRGQVVETTTTAAVSPVREVALTGGEWDRRVHNLTPDIWTAEGDRLVVNDGVVSGLGRARWRAGERYLAVPIEIEIGQTATEAVFQAYTTF